jgi:uncharacterized protein YndB with AHSA1/START domain
MSHELRVERLIDASPEDVFDAYVSPEAQKAWFTIFDPEMIVENQVDLRVGGRWVSAWGFSADELFRETQVFEVIDRPHRLVTTSAGSEPGGETLATRIEITFQAKDGKTLMTIVQQGFPTADARDFFADTAWIGFFDRLEAYFAAKSAG